MNYLAHLTMSIGILLFFTEPTPNLGILRKLSSKLIFLTPWWGGLSFIAVRKFGMSSAISILLLTLATTLVLSAWSMSPSGESDRVQWRKFVILQLVKRCLFWMLLRRLCSHLLRGKLLRLFLTLPISF